MQTISYHSRNHLRSISTLSTNKYILKHQISTLLNYFNQLDSNDSGLINKKSAQIFFNSIQCKQDYQKQLKYQYYSFDHLLSILGRVEIPQQPIIYVLVFIRTLIKFKEKCMNKSSLNQQQEDNKLIQARQIDQKINKIIKTQIQRQIINIQMENNIIYQEMQQNQNKQLQAFQLQWSLYLQDFQQSNYKKYKQNSLKKRRQLQQQQTKFILTSRRHNLLTSTKLQQLQQKKKRFVKQGNYNLALMINQKIKTQKLRISLQKQQKTQFTAQKRYDSLRKKNQTIMQTSFMNMNVNIKKLIAKKKQGETLLQIRMKSIRQETKKKLNQKTKEQINKIKSLFYQQTKKKIKKYQLNPQNY